MPAPWWKAKSTIVRGRKPDDARGGYPWALQYWNDDERCWGWVYTGSARHGQPRPGFRYVFVKRWVRARGGLAAQIDAGRTVYPKAP